MYSHLQFAGSDAPRRRVLYVDATGQHVAAKAKIIEFIGHLPAERCQRKS